MINIDMEKMIERNEFITDNFLLENKTAENLYHNHVKNLPIIDYHCHLPVNEIAEDRKFQNLTQLWLNGDHYKWRAMRANGIDEKYCTGDAPDWDKFLAWAKTVPFTVRNPLYHWTHLELKNTFGISKILLNEKTAKVIWDECNSLLNTPSFSAKELIKKSRVETVCSTDDPIDSLDDHIKIKKENYSVNVLPTFRPDKGMMIENYGLFNLWFKRLKELSNIDINNFQSYIEALRKRHQFFHENGCRLSDHGFDNLSAEDYTSSEIENIFSKVLVNKKISSEEILKFKSAMMYEFGLMDHEKNWVQQLHIGAIRNTNSRKYRTLGPDTGFDSIGDLNIAQPLAKFLSSLDDQDNLPKTIIYNLNPADNEMIAAMTGNFQDGKIAGKIQYGSGWWFLDQKDGIEKQLNVLSNLGLLSRFVGMLTDSRSFLSYPRHDYFRRILCSLIGKDVENGLIPDSEDLFVPLVKNISYYNAKNYFGFGEG